MRENKDQKNSKIKSSSAAVIAAFWTVLGPHGSVQVSTTIKLSSAAVLAADDDFIVVETCTDQCGPNTVQRAASTAADDDFKNSKYGHFSRSLINQKLFIYV